MIVDTSVIIAILNEEDEAKDFIQIITEADAVRLSTGNYLEVAIISDNKAFTGAKLDKLIEEAFIVIEPVTADHVRIARKAYLKYGKGNHPARLNYGDCFAYALAKETGEPLLFKGNDFSKTDILAA